MALFYVLLQQTISIVDFVLPAPHFGICVVLSQKTTLMMPINDTRNVVRDTYRHTHKTDIKHDTPGPACPDNVFMTTLMPFQGRSRDRHLSPRFVFVHASLEPITQSPCHTSCLPIDFHPHCLINILYTRDLLFPQVVKINFFYRMQGNIFIDFTLLLVVI